MSDYKRGDVVLVNLEPIRGSEQGLVRPCVVMSDLETIQASNSKPLYVIIPLTRSNTLKGKLAPRLRAKANNLPSDSTALIMHVRSIDYRRIIKRVTSLSKNDIKTLQLGLYELFNA